MRKLFTLVALIMAIAVSSCGYDDTSVVNSISDLLQRVSALEELQNASDVGLLIESITETSDGYIVKFTDGSEITLYNGTDGKDDANDDSTCLLKDIVITDDYVTFYLIDGNSFTFNFSSQRETVGVEFDIEDGVACMAGTSLEFGYTITGGYNDADIECWGNAGWDASIIKTNATEGKIKVISPKESKNGKVVVLVISPSGGNCMKAILFDEGIVENIVESYEAGWEANTLKVDFRTNLEYDVRIPAEAQAWLSVAETRATIRDSYIIFNIAENGEGAPIRSAVVELVNDANEVLYSFDVCQKSQPSSACIEFADQYAKQVCVGKFDINGDGEFSQKEASKVEFLDSNFFGAYNQNIKSFDELQYFVNLKSILDNAFYGCNNLQSLFIPDSVTKIGDAAFYSCSSLTSVNIPDSVTTIGEWTFSWCESLTSVTIPDSVTTIGYAAFSVCSSLTSVTIPDSVTTIGSGAFAWCSSLTSVYCKVTTPPAGGSDMFSDNASGRKIYVPMESVEAYKSAEGWSEYAADIVGYDFENGVVVTPKPANNEIWYTNGSTTEATTPYNTNVFGANIVSNTYDAAKECWVIKFDSEVTTIGDVAFRGRSLTSITIPDSVTTIGWSAFEGCSSLTSVTIPDSVTTIEGSAFSWCENLTSVTIPDSVTTIGEGAFCGCSSFTSVTIPDSVTTIEDFTFCECSSITSVTIPDSVTTIGNYAFYQCISLTSVTIPDSVTEIGERAFGWCDSLTSVTIGDSVTSIGECVFEYCSCLTSVYCKATTPPVGGADMFCNNDSERKIYVPTESVEAYKSAEGWSEYAADIAAYDFENNVAITSGYLNGYEWVDLGLSVKWASYNVGATAPYECGDYFAWAEISPKDEYTEHTYLYWTDHNSNGVWDDWENTMLEDIAGNPEYDAAAAIWGGGWRMPTLEEQLELRDNCTWDWILLNDTNCLQVTGPNGSSIYIPAAGYRYESGYYDVNGTGYYWSSTPADGTDFAANYLRIYWSDDGDTGYLTSHFTSDWSARIAGVSIRPVLDK